VQEYTEGEDSELLIAVYDSEAAALAAIDRLKDKSGLVNLPEGFQVHSRELGQESWTEGFVLTD